MTDHNPNETLVAPDPSFSVERMVQEIATKHGYLLLNQPIAVCGVLFTTHEGWGHAQNWYRRSISTDHCGHTIWNSIIPSKEFKIPKPDFECLHLFGIQFVCHIPEKHILRKIPNLITTYSRSK